MQSFAASYLMSASSWRHFPHHLSLFISEFQEQQSSMDFPEVWNFERKDKRLRPETFPASDNVGAKIISKIPFANLVSHKRLNLL